MKASLVRKTIYSLMIGFLMFGVSNSMGILATGSDLLTVCTAGPPVCTTDSLQAAAAVASDGSTIFVDPGVFAGPVIVGKNLTIIGAGAAQTVVGGGIIVAGPFQVTIRALQVTAGLNGIQGQAAPGLPEIFSPAITLESVTVTGNAGNGVAAFNNTSIFMTDVNIVQNGLTVQGQPIGSGVAVRGNSSVSIGGNSVIELSGGNGVVATDNANLSIGGNVLVQMSQLSGVQVGGNATASISNLTGQANGCYGIDVADNSNVTITGGTFQGNAAAGIHVGGPSSTLIGCTTLTDPEINATATVENSVVSGNPIGILVGDFSKVFDQASLTGIGVVFLGNGADLVVDPVGPKNVDMN